MADTSFGLRTVPAVTNEPAEAPPEEVEQSRQIREHMSAIERTTGKQGVDALIAVLSNAASQTDARAA